MEIHELKEACQNPDITDEKIYDLFQSFSPSDEEEFDKALTTVMKYRSKALDVTITKKKVSNPAHSYTEGMDII